MALMIVSTAAGGVLVEGGKKYPRQRTAVVTGRHDLLSGLLHLDFGVDYRKPGGVRRHAGAIAVVRPCRPRTPKGGEAFGYALMMSVWNIGMSLSDVCGSWLFAAYHLSFMNLVWLNVGTTALALLAVPLLPARIVGQREEDGTPAE